MKIAGVDAGQKGCVALFDTVEDIFTLHDNVLLEDRTLDTRWLFDLLLEWEPDIVIVEDCFRGKKIIRFAGEVAAVAKILGVELQVINVATWKKEMLGQNTSNKSVSINRCKKLRPEVDLIRKRTENADRAEAVLLALFAERRNSPKSKKSK